MNDRPSVGEAVAELLRRGSNSGAPQRLNELIGRIERLNEEKAALSDDIKDIYTIAKAEGYDPKIMRIVVRERKIDQAARDERDALVDTYMRALGDYATLPLGQAAVEKVRG